MPMTPRCQPSPPTTSTLCAPMAGSRLDRLPRLRDQVGFLLLAAQVLLVQLLREVARFVAHRLGGGEQQAGGDVRGAHPPRGVHAGREHERDLIAVDRLAGEPGGIEQRARPMVCGPLLSDASPSRAMTRFSPTSGTTSASVPIAATFTKAGSQRVLPGARAQRLHQLQRDADARQVLVRVGAVVPLRVDDRERRRQLAVGLVVVGDDQVDAELARAACRLRAANAAVHRDDHRDALGVQPLDRRGLEAVAVLDPLGDEVASPCRRAAPGRGAG